MKFNFRETLFRIWYWYVNRIDKNAEILFMNFGYSKKGDEIHIDEQNEINRYCTQLYHHLAIETEIKNKDIVEIGSGRGGGLFYIAKNFAAKTAIGIDLDKQAAEFCNRHYSLDGLSFQQGDAQNLNLKDSSCDVLFNIESSHRYPDMKAFLGEVSRILRPNGHFLITDFRYEFEIEELKQEIESSGLTLLKTWNINSEVVRALELDDQRKRDLVKKLAPKFLHKIALNFGGTIGSETYNQFKSKKYIYSSYVLKKQ